MDKKIAIIDLGSSSIRLVIYQLYRNGAYKLIDDIHHKIRLAENMVDSRFLNDTSMKKAYEVIMLFKQLCSNYDIHSRDIIAVATAAVRKAENRDDFLRTMFSMTGLTFRIISGETEALYDYESVIHTMDYKEGIIMDIGGGSAEIIRFEADKETNYLSIPLGAVTAAEYLVDNDNISLEKLSMLEQNIEKVLKQYDWLLGMKNRRIIGIGGTHRTLAKIHMHIADYPLEIIHNYSLTVNDFYKIYDELKVMDLIERKKVEGLSSERADVIIGGFAILKILSKITDTSDIVICGNGLREGLLLEYLFKNDPQRKDSDVLDFSLRNYMDVLGTRQTHACHIADLSISMFDQLSDQHKLNNDVKKLLKVAALLHDIGISISFYNHCIHSFYMILNSSLNGLSHSELLIIALTAASHHSGKVKKALINKYNRVLSQEDVKIIQILSLFLTIAECLDRSEIGNVRSVECRIENSKVVIKTFSDNDSEPEIRQAKESAETFLKIFGMTIEII